MTNRFAFNVFLFVPFCAFLWLFFPLCGVVVEFCKRLSSQCPARDGSGNTWIHTQRFKDSRSKFRLRFSSYKPRAIT